MLSLAATLLHRTSHAGDDHFDRTTFLTGHLHWQDFADEDHEGPGVLVGLAYEVFATACVAQRTEDISLRR
jgi:hypothetical protein